MSTTIDQRVVEMRFDNKHFENNVATTMSTLEKLKQKLHLPGAVKGLDDVSKAAKKVDLSEIGNSADKVGLKFDAMYTIADQALRNITNSAMAAGKKIISALTIDPVKTGFQEYETQMNAVQTILANTQSKGSTLDDVNNALENLNKYADQTIYNFTEMTRNIGTFTAAGVDLQTSVDSIKGIANLAAVSGSTSQQASTAMYQLSQALAAGRVSLMDWNSVVNAGMGGELFQNALLRTSELLQTGGKEAVEMYGSFRESLTKGQWLTTDVLTETLKQLSGAYSKAELIEQGFTEEQAEEISKLAQTATDAATKVKTFTQLWDVMKEAAQSGWAQSWKIIVGDFEEAKALFTPLADFFTGIINGISDARNALLEGALASGFGSLLDAFTNITEPLSNTVDSVKGTVDALKDYSVVVDEILSGAWGNGQARWDSLAKAGYDWAHAQNLVNERLGDSTRHATDYKEAQNGVAEAQNGVNEAQEKALEIDAEHIATLAELTDVELRRLGYTTEQIEALRELQYQADKTGIPLKEFIEHIDEINGRYLLINSFKNIGKGIVKSIQAITGAFRDIFPPMTAEQLYNIIAGFHKLSMNFVMSDETADKLRRTFRGLFAALDIILTIVGGPIKIAFKVLTKLLGSFDMDILSVTANIGDAIVGFRDWIDNALDFGKIFESIVPCIKNAMKGFKDWIGELKKSENIPLAIMQGIANGFVSAGKFISNAISGAINSVIEFAERLLGVDLPTFEEYVEIGKNIIQGLLSGLGGVGKVFEFVINIGKTILSKIKEVLGIHSPSTETAEIGKNIVLGLFNGIKETIGIVWDLVKNSGLTIVEIIKNLDLGSLISAVISVGMIVGFVKIASFLQNIGAALDGFGGVCDSISDGVTRITKAFSTKIKADAVKSFSIAIGILAASVFVLAQLEPGRLWSTIGAVAVLMVAIGTFSALVGKFGPDDAAKFGQVALAVLGISVSLTIVASAMKKVSDIKVDNAGVWMLIGVLAAMLTAMVLFGKFANPAVIADMAKASLAFIAMSVAVNLMAKVIKKFKDIELNQDQIYNILECVGGIIAIMAVLSLITKLGGRDLDRLGGTMIKMAVAIGLIALIASKLKDVNLTGEQILTIAGCIGGIMLVLLAMVKLVNLANKDFAKVGTTLLGIAAAIGILALVAKMLSEVDLIPLAKGVIAVGFLGVIVGTLIFVCTKSTTDKEMARVGRTILAMSIAIGVLGGIAALLGLIPIDKLRRGVIAVGILSGLMMGMMACAKFAAGSTGAIIALSVAIGIMVGSLAVLTMLDPSGIKTAGVVMTVLMGVLSGLLAVSQFAKGSMGVIITLTVAIGLMGGIVALLANQPWQQSLGAAAALSLFMATMTGLLAALGFIQPLASKALAGILALTVMAVPLLAFVGVLCLMKNVQNATENAIALSVLAGALSIMLIPLSLVGVLMASTGGMAALGIVALLAMAVPLVAFVGVLALMQNIKNATENINLLTGLLNTLTKTLVILAIVGPLATVGVSAMSGLTLLIGAIGVMVTAVGALMEKFPALEEFLDKGIVILEKLAHAIGSVIGNIIDGFMTAATENLPLIGTRLSEFMTNLTPFLNGVKAMDEGAGSKIASLVGAILALTAADLITGIVNFISGGGSSLAQLGTNLSQFMINAMPFISGAAMLNEDLLVGVKNLASIVTTLTANSILEGLASWLTGESSLASFGAQLGALGTNLAAFVTNLGTFSEDQVMTVDCAGRAIKALATAASEIPNEGGWVSKIVGENSLSAFGSELGTLGTNLRNFVVNLGTFTDAQVTTVDCAGKALKALASAADSIPNEGGWAAKICGDNSLATFGDKLPGLGSDISGFVKNLGTFGEDKISTVESACEAMTTITKLGKLDLKSLSNNVESLGGKLTDFGGKLKEFCSSMSNISSEGLSDAILKVSRIVALIKKISELNLNSVSNFGKDLKKIAKEGIKGFVDELSGDDPLEKVKDAADKIIKAYIKAVKKTKSDVKKAFKTVASEGVKGAEDKGVYNDFKDAGKYMVEGFAKGITANDFKAEAAAKAMAKAAKKAAEKALGIESPSKEMAKDGKYTVLGFVKGISDNLREIFKMGSEMGVEFKDGLEDSLDINSPSKETSKDAKFSVDGFVDTIKDHFKTAFESGFDFGEMFKAGIDASMLNQIQVDPKLTASYDDAVDSSINSAKNFKSSSDQIAALKELKKVLVNDVKSIEKIDSEIFGIQEKDISDLKSFDKLTTKAELQMYKDLQKEYSSDSEQGKSIAKKIYDLEKSNDDKIIEDMKSSGKTGLAGELAYYRDLRNKYLENPAYLETIDKKIYDLEKDLSEKTATYLKESEELAKEYSDRRLELEAEYDEKCKENAENRKAEIAEIEQKYTDAHAQRVSQLKDYRGLFDAVDEKEKVNASDILKNQKDQIDEMMEYSYNFESLAGRITNKDLLKELQEMGPEAAAYIQALNEMSDSQLSKFVSNYETKNEYANRMATNDLIGLRAEVDAEKAAATSKWDKEFGKIHGEYYGMYAINEDGTLSYKPGAFENLEKEQNEAMTDLKNSFLESIGAAGPEMETEFEKLSDNLVAKLADTEQWNKTGEQVIDGIDAGLKNKEGTLYATVTGIAAQMISAMQSALAIHSPSRKFAEIGKYIDLGLASGMTNYANVVKTSALSLSDSAINTVQNSVSRIMDIINSGVEIRPTISPVMSPSSVNLGNVADVFNGKSSPRVLAEVGEISYMFNKRSQNGTNDDIVSAIDKLHGDMGKFGNNTYNINGVTYDDGTNISEAVETLVRAARVERRR